MLPCLEQPYGSLAQGASSDVARNNKRKRGGQKRKQKKDINNRPPSYFRRENKRLEFDPYCNDDSQLIAHLNLVHKSRHCYCPMCRAVREHMDCDCYWCEKTRGLQTQLVCSSCA